jgi:hypothetical protein
MAEHMNGQPLAHWPCVMMQAKALCTAASPKHPMLACLCQDFGLLFVVAIWSMLCLSTAAEAVSVLACLLLCDDIGFATNRAEGVCQGTGTRHSMTDV